MAKLTEKYEAVLVFSLKGGEDHAKTLQEKFTALIKDHGTLANTAVWGKRRLAYPINYEADGFYVLYYFDSVPDFPKELERVLNITDGVLRFLVTLRKSDEIKTSLTENTSSDEPRYGGSYRPYNNDRGDRGDRTASLNAAPVSTSDAVAETAEVAASAETSETVAEVAVSAETSETVVEVVAESETPAGDTAE